METGRGSKTNREDDEVKQSLKLKVHEDSSGLLQSGSRHCGGFQNQQWTAGLVNKSDTEANDQGLGYGR